MASKATIESLAKSHIQNIETQSEKIQENADEEFAHCPPGWTKESWDSEMNWYKDHPLFMNQEQIENNLESNEFLMALQSLKYDEDPEVTIEKLYKEANEMFKEHYIKDKSNRFYIKRILLKYTDCILLNPQDKALKAKILANRALINLPLKNYGRVIEDCREAIKCDEKFIKPYFRMCEALLMLERFDECLKTAELG